jgi:hypothetical protein
MAVAIEAKASASVTGASTLNAPSITPAGSNRLLLAVAGSDQSPVATSLVQTRNSGVAMTLGWSDTYETYFRNSGYYTINPAASAVVCATAANASQYGMYIAAIAFSGVDQTTPLGTPVTGSTAAGATFSASPTSAANDLVIDNYFGNADTVTPNQGNTMETEQEDFVADDTGGVSSKAGASGSVTIGHSRTNTAFGIGLVAVSIKNDGSGGGGGGLPFFLQDHIKQGYMAHPSGGFQ